LNSNKKIVKYYRIPCEKMADLERELFNLGLHEGSLFPEIDRQAVYLEQAW